MRACKIAVAAHRWKFDIEKARQAHYSTPTLSSLSDEPLDPPQQLTYLCPLTYPNNSIGTKRLPYLFFLLFLTLLAVPEALRWTNSLSNRFMGADAMVRGAELAGRGDWIRARQVGANTETHNTTLTTTKLLRRHRNWLVLSYFFPPFF